MLAVKGKGHVPQQRAAVDAGDQRRAVQGIEDLAADGQELAQGRGIGLAPGGILLRPLGVFLHQQVHQGRSQAKAAPYLHTTAHVHDGDGGDHVGQAAAAGQVDAVAGFGGQGARELVQQGHGLAQAFPELGKVPVDVVQDGQGRLGRVEDGKTGLYRLKERVGIQVHHGIGRQRARRQAPQQGLGTAAAARGVVRTHEDPGFGLLRRQQARLKIQGTQGGPLGRQQPGAARRELAGPHRPLRPGFAGDPGQLVIVGRCRDTMTCQHDDLAEVIRGWGSRHRTGYQAQEQGEQSGEACPGSHEDLLSWWKHKRKRCRGQCLAHICPQPFCARM